MEGLVKDVLEVFEVASEEELLNNYGVNDFYKKVEEDVFSYDEFITLGYLDVEDVTNRIGVEEALAEGLISKEEAEVFKKMKKEGLI